MRTAESFPGILAGQLSRDSSYLEEIHLKSLSPDSSTIASCLSKQGYNTVATITNPQLSTIRNFDIGFDQFRNLESNASSQIAQNQPQNEESSGPPLSGLLDNFRRCLNNIDSAPVNPFVPAYVAYREIQRRTEWPTVPAETVVDEFLADLEATTEPFFGWTHLMDLHAPLHPGRINAGGLLSASSLTQFWWDSKRVRGSYESNYERMYDSALKYVDAQIGRLIQNLKVKDLWDETLLIVTGDHGESLYDRGVYGHGEGEGQFAHVDTGEIRHHYMYDDVIKVPLLIHGSEASVGRIEKPFSLCWLGDLITDYLDVEAPTFPQSRKESSEAVIADAVTNEGHTLAVRTDEWKLITSCSTNAEDIRENTTNAYYISADPGERVPVSDVPDTLIETAAELVVNPDNLPTLDGQVDAATKQRLSDLGYR